MSADRRTDRQPAVVPGQVWIIEQASAPALSPLACNALTTANVVLYPRRLAALVAEALPNGTYAEPLSGEAEARGAVAARALAFARDGWSVVQLVAVQPEVSKPAAEFAEHPRALIVGPAGPPRIALNEAFTANGLAG